jgi:hypothetical protein
MEPPGTVARRGLQAVPATSRSARSRVTGARADVSSALCGGGEGPPASPGRLGARPRTARSRRTAGRSPAGY